MALLIGMTYDLREDYLAEGYSALETAEFDSHETIDAIEKALTANGYDVERIGNIKTLVKALAGGKSWDMVFNICEGLSGSAREAQVPALLDAYNIPYVFSDPAVLMLTLDKSLAKRIVRDAGLNTAPFAVVQHFGEVETLDLDFPLFVKPVGEGSSKGITGKSLVHDIKDLKESCRYVLETFRQPALVETFLPGREFTVGVFEKMGEYQAIGALEIYSEHDGQVWIKQSFDEESASKNAVKFRLAEDAAARKSQELAVACAEALRCRSVVRIDIRLDDSGVPAFIEANPLPNFHPIQASLVVLARETGISYEKLIGRMVENTLANYNLTTTRTKKAVVKLKSKGK